VRILFLSQFYYPHIGGVEKHIRNLSKDLLEKGHEVFVLTQKHDQSLLDEEVFENVRIMRFYYPKIKFLGLIYIWAFFIKRYLSFFKSCDLIHAHDVFVWYFPFRFLLPKKPVFVTFHGWEGKYPIPIRSIVLKKISARLASGVIVVGEYIKKYYGVESDYVIYGGCENKILEGKKNLKKAAFVGRLEKDTGILILLKALEKYESLTVKGKYKWDFEFYGDGSLRKRAEKYGVVKGFIYDVEERIKPVNLLFTGGYLASLEGLVNKCLVVAICDNQLKRDCFVMSPFRERVIIAETVDEVFSILKLPPQKIRKMFAEKNYKWALSQSWQKITKIYLKLWKEKI